MICNKFHNIAAEKVSLKERKHLLHTISDRYFMPKRGGCRGWTLKDEIDDHCSQNLRNILIYKLI